MLWREGVPFPNGGYGRIECFRETHFLVVFAVQELYL